jgi:hypothetical protein
LGQWNQNSIWIPDTWDTWAAAILSPRPFYIFFPMPKQY